MKKINKLFRKSVASMLSVAMIFQLVTVSAADLTGNDKNKGNQGKPIYNISQIIVKYKKGADRNTVKTTVANKSSDNKITTKKQLIDPNSEVIDVGSTDDMQSVLDELQKNSSVEYAEPNYKLTSFDYTTEPMYSQQWGLQNNGQTVNGKTGVAGNDINVTPAWSISNGSGVLVGVLDTGIYISHSDLAANIFTNTKEIAGNSKDDDNNGYVDDVHGYDFINHDSTVFDSAANDQHGTNVAGVIAAAANNSGIVGVAPNAQLLPLKIMSGTTGYTSDAIDAIEYAKKMGVKIMNVSWGGSDYNYALKDEMSSADMLFVCAAGNDGSDATAYPAAFKLPNIISVGAIDNQGNITSYTDTGTAPDIYAPGDNIVTTDSNGGYATVSGTSFSAAYVSGIAALVKQAVPQITTDELKLALTNGYAEKGSGKIRVADANNAIKNALPIKYLNDANGRLSQAMAYAGKIITPAVAGILTESTSWSQLNDSDKTTLTAFFNVSANDMATCATGNLNLTDSVVALLAAQKVGISASTVISLINKYNNNTTFDSEISNLAGLYGQLQLSSSEKSGIVSLMQGGYKVSQIVNALIVAKTINVDITAVINPLNVAYNFSNTGYTGSDLDSFSQLLQKYNLNETYILNYLKTNSIKPSALLTNAYNWQKSNNLYIINNKVAAFSAATDTISGFNKYKVSTGNVWTAGNASIDKTDGTLTYTEPLLSLGGRNGLNLNLGLRFDSDVADAQINANDSSLLNYNFRVTENRQYYNTMAAATSRDSSNRDSAKDVTKTYTYTEDSQLSYWENQDGIALTDSSDNEAYVENITITSSVDTSRCSISASNLTNYNNRRYGLGIGWALDMPSIEMTGTQMYLHLPGGSKYLLKVNTDGNYLIDGYKLQDVAFGNATGADFTVNNVAATYYLLSKDGSKAYFASDGRYLGTKDIIGNAIQVYYNSDGSFNRIYDTAGRYVQFNYSTGTNTKTVTLQLVDNTASNPQTQTLYTINETLDSFTNTYNLASLTDSLGRTTNYGYSSYNSSVTFNYRSNIASAFASGTPLEKTNKAIALNSVTTPTGAVTKYDYTTAWKQYGYASDRSYMRVGDTYSLAISTATTQNGYTAFNYSIKSTNQLLADKTYSGQTSDYTDLGASNYDFSNGFTIQFTAHFDSANSYSRIFDFGNGAGSDNIVVCEDGTSNQLDFRIFNGTTQTPNQISVANGIVFGETANWKIDVDCAGNVNIYKNGVIVGHGKMPLPNNVTRSNSYLGKSNWSGDAMFKGEISNFTLTTNAKTDNTYWMYSANNIYPLMSGLTGQSTEIVGNDTSTPSNNSMQIFNYDTSNLATSQTICDGADNNKTTSIIISRDNYGQPIEVQQKTYSSDESTYTQSDTSYTWDQYGNQLSSKTQSGDQTGLKSVDSQGSNVFDYTKSKTIPTSTLQYSQQTADGTQYATEVDNTIDAAKQQVDETVNSIYNLTVNPAAVVTKLSTADYTYDQYGNVTDSILNDNTDNAAVDSVVGTVNKVVETSCTYDPQYQIYQATKTANNVTDADGNAVKKADGTTSTSVTTSSQYNMFGQPTSATDANGFTTLIKYDDGGNVLTVTNPDSSVMSNVYDFANRTVITTDVDGTASKVVYDTFGNPVNTYRLNTNKTSYDQISNSTYDNLMRLSTEIDYLTTDKSKYDTTTYIYDAFGRATSTTVKDQSGTVIAGKNTTYNQAAKNVGGLGSLNQTTSVVLTNTTDSTKNYQAVNSSDALGRSVYTENYTTSSSANELTGTSTYGSFNNLTATASDTTSTDYSSNATDLSSSTTTGDTSNQSSTDYLKSTENYNGFGQQIISTDANGNSAYTVYDAMGRAIETYTPFDKDSSGNIIYSVKKTYYDAGGRVIEEKQQNNKEGAATSSTDTKYTYDNMGNLLMVEQVNGTQGSQFTQYYYGLKGRVLRTYTGLTSPLTINGLDSVTPSGDNSYGVTKYAYDFYGDITSYTDGDGNTESYKYNDLTGQLLEKDLRNSDVVTYTYDNAGNILKIIGTQSGKTTLTNTYTYNLAGSLLEAINASCDTKYTYDDAGRMTKETDVYTGGGSYEKDYTYDGSNIKTITIKRNNVTQNVFTYGFDSSTGRLATIDYNSLYSLSYGYDKNGNVTNKSVTNDNASQTATSSSYTYYPSNLVSTYTGTYSASNYSQTENYSYQLDGNLISKSVTGSNYTNYSYDNLGRMDTETSGTATSGDQAQNVYSFDDYNNRTGLTYTNYVSSSENTQTNYTYDSANRLQTQGVISENDESKTDYSYNYDNAGNLLNKQQLQSGNPVTVESFAYDALNETSSITNGSVATSFKYDANDQRISKTSGSTTTESLWDGGSIVADFATTGSTTTYNQYLSGNMGAIINGGTAYTNLINGQGDAIATANSSTNAISSYSFDAYGNKTSGSTTATPFSYRNQYSDSETGLYYLNARYYDPSAGSFTQEDTYWGSVKSPATLNLYGYCEGNPVMASDPTGHYAQVKQGSKCSDVKTLQNDLNLLGYTDYNYNVLEPDGSFGPKTDSAVRKFQKAKGLAQDGIVGPLTWAALTSAVAAKQASTSNCAHYKIEPSFGGGSSGGNNTGNAGGAGGNGNNGQTQNQTTWSAGQSISTSNIGYTQFNTIIADDSSDIGGCLVIGSTTQDVQQNLKVTMTRQANGLFTLQIILLSLYQPLYNPWLGTVGISDTQNFAKVNGVYKGMSVYNQAYFYPSDEKMNKSILTLNDYSYTSGSLLDIEGCTDLDSDSAPYVSIASISIRLRIYYK